MGRSHLLGGGCFEVSAGKGKMKEVEEKIEILHLPYSRPTNEHFVTEISGDNQREFTRRETLSSSIKSFNMIRI